MVVEMVITQLLWDHCPHFHFHSVLLHRLRGGKAQTLLGNPIIPSQGASKFQTGLILIGLSIRSRSWGLNGYLLTHVYIMPIPKIVAGVKNHLKMGQKMHSLSSPYAARNRGQQKYINSTTLQCKTQKDWLNPTLLPNRQGWTLKLLTGLKQPKTVQGLKFDLGIQSWHSALEFNVFVCLQHT